MQADLEAEIEQSARHMAERILPIVEEELDALSGRLDRLRADVDELMEQP
jgi:hypothetical protein